VPVTQARIPPVETPLRRIVIAGGPGSGKSTLLQALTESGEICYEESSRTLIREQLAKGGPLVPWGDLAAFAQECSERMRAQLADSERHGRDTAREGRSDSARRGPLDTARRGRCFFDRGLPDLIGYLSRAGHSAPDAWRAASRAYASAAFFAPPWREIFVNDAERPQSFAEAQELSTHIRRAYLDCGFQIIDLVKSSVADRLRQVFQYLDAHQDEHDHG
jgi:predicted ATPase